MSDCHTVDLSETREPGDKLHFLFSVNECVCGIDREAPPLWLFARSNHACWAPLLNQKPCKKIPLWTFKKGGLWPAAFLPRVLLSLILTGTQCCHHWFLKFQSVLLKYVYHLLFLSSILWSHGPPQDQTTLRYTKESMHKNILFLKNHPNNGVNTEETYSRLFIELNVNNSAFNSTCKYSPWNHCCFSMSCLYSQIHWYFLAFLATPPST